MKQNVAPPKFKPDSRGGRASMTPAMAVIPESAVGRLSGTFGIVPVAKMPDSR
jgi:hypothetical protein